MFDSLPESIGWVASTAGVGQAFVLAQIVVSGEGLGQRAQLVLVLGMVACQVLAILLIHQRASSQDDDE